MSLPLLRRLLLSLPGPLRLRLLSGLSAPLLRLVLLLRCACLRPLRLPLRALLLCGWLRAVLLPPLLLFGLAPFFILPVLLRVRRDNRPEKQEQGSSTRSSNELHRNHLR